jgi:aminoglycoside phosphotransferase (APT) family kinase protein
MQSATTRERARSALRAHAPQLAAAEIAELGHGLDHTAFVSGDLVLRVADAGDVGREARLLERLAPQLSLPIPTPRFADVDAGVLAYEKLPGRPLLGRSPPADAAHHLGRFLRELHAVDPATVDDLAPTEAADPTEWLEDLDGPADLLDVVQASRPEPVRQRVLAHADLGAEHILELDGALTGIIDWSDAAITDPALDFARLYRDFGPGFLGATLDAYGPLPGATARIEFFARCAALEDLAFGRRTRRLAYAANAERSFGWLLARRG